MIVLYTGTPGGGKSLAMARKVHFILTVKRGSVISTVAIDTDYLSYGGQKKIGKFVHKPIFEISPDFFYRHAYENHRKGKEGQTSVFIDECQLIFNSRDFAARDRRAWLEFFTHHRHFGYNFYLITQHDRMLDRQIRALVEIEYKHRKLNNVLWFLPFKLFVQVETWYGGPRAPKLRAEYFVLRRKFARLYDTHAMWDELESKVMSSEKPGPPARPAAASAARAKKKCPAPDSSAELSALRARLVSVLRAHADFRASESGFIHNVDKSEILNFDDKTPQVLSETILQDCDKFPARRRPVTMARRLAAKILRETPGFLASVARDFRVFSMPGRPVLYWAEGPLFQYPRNNCI